MLTEVNRSKMVNQSYLRMGQAGGFHGVNEVKRYLVEDTAFIAHAKGKKVFEVS